MLTLLCSMLVVESFAHDIEVANNDGVTIYYNWINNNTELEVSYRGNSFAYGYLYYHDNVVIPESVIYNGKPYPVTSIGEAAFYSCHSLKNVTIPNSVTTIGRVAFSGCGFGYLQIPSSVTSIGSSAFSGCNIVYIPNSVVSIGDGAFANCYSVTLQPGNSVYDSRDNCNAIIETNSNTLIAGFKDTTIPNSVTSIGSSAFSGCSGLTSITIPNSVTSIGNSAFSGCSGLTSITIPNSVTSIGNDAFFVCSGLTSITIPNSVTSIGNYAFSGCSGLTSVTFGNSVTTIGGSAFSGCSGLTSLTIPQSVTSIGYRAFSSTGLTFVELQCSATTDLVADVFPECPLKEVKFDCEKVTSLLSRSSVEKITMTNNVTSIDASAFVSCFSLTSVTIPNSVTSIGPAAFAACPNLASIIVEEGNTIYDSRNNCNAIIETASNSLIAGCKNTCIPNSVTTIYNAAFAGNFTLTSVTIPNSVTTIMDYAFDSSGLTSITISKSVTSIGNTAFANCTQLTDVFCYAEEVPSTPSNAFEASSLSGATLHVPATAVKAYSEASPWSGFNSIAPIEVLEPCATPTIAFKNGKVMFSCETEGVDFVYEITNADVQNGSGAEVSLGTTYHISVYATKEGYENSEIATADIDARGIVGDLSGDGNVDATDLTRLIDIILKKKQ